MKPRRLELPVLEPHIRQLCGLLVLLSVVTPIAWAWIAGPGVAGPVKMFGLPMLKVAGIALLLWQSPELRKFVHRSFWLDMRAWPTAFVAATILMVVPLVLDAAWRLYGVATSSTPDTASDWIAATAPLSGSTGGRVFIVLYFCTVSVISEEIVYRCLTLVSLPKLTHPIIYAFLSSVAFAFAHFTQGVDKVVSIVLLLGLPLALYYVRTQNLGATSAFHATFNLWALGTIFFR